MAKEFLKIWFSDIELANDFFDGNDKHLGEFLVNVYRSYAELPTSFRCKQVEKYFKTYCKQIEFIKKAKADGLKAHLQDAESQEDKRQTLEGGVQGGVQPPPPSTLPSTLEAKGEKKKEKGESKKVKEYFIAPTFDEFHSFCKEKGFEHIAKKAFDYYSGNDWKDNQNKKVKNWKLKLQSVWFDETKNPKPAPVPTAPPQPVDDRDIYQYFQYTHGNNELYYKVLRVNAEDYFQRELSNTSNKCIPKDDISPERRAKATLIRT